MLAPQREHSDCYSSGEPEKHVLPSDGRQRRIGESVHFWRAQITPFIFYLVGGYYAIMGYLDVGQLVAVIMAYKDLPGPIKELIDWDLQRQDVEIKYNQVMDQFHPEGMRPAEDVSLPVPTAEIDKIELKSVSVSDDSGFVLLDDIDTHLPLDQSVAAVGPSGSGKEAFGQLFTRQIVLKDGSIKAGANDFFSMNDAVVGRQIAYAGAEAYFFPTGIKENILYGLKTAIQPLANDQKPERKRQLREMQRTGNPTFDAQADWIDYVALGSGNASQVLDRIIEILCIVGLENDVYQFGLQSKLDPIANKAAADRIVEARLALHEQLEQADLNTLVERFDPNAFNRNASIAENIMFGASSDPKLQSQNLPQLGHFQRVIAEEGLEADLVTMGQSIAETMIELFSELPPDHPFFDEYGFIPSSELPQFQQIIKRAKSGSLNYSDRASLSALPLTYVDARHRLGLITNEIRDRLLAARRTFADTVPKDMKSRISFYNETTYNDAASILDNILLGRVSYGVAQAQERVGQLIRELLDKLDVRDLIIEAGLNFNCGAGGKRLSTAQRQKLSLARAMIKEPRLLVVNGALANLDDAQKTQIVDRVLQHRKSKATFWILTKDDLATKFDRTLVFEHGRLKSDTVNTSQREVST